MTLNIHSTREIHLKRINVYLKFEPEGLNYKRFEKALQVTVDELYRVALSSMNQQSGLV